MGVVSGVDETQKIAQNRQEAEKMSQRELQDKQSARRSDFGTERPLDGFNLLGEDRPKPRRPHGTARMPVGGKTRAKERVRTKQGLRTICPKSLSCKVQPSGFEPPRGVKPH